MPVPIRREVGCGPMIVDITAVSRDLAVRSIAQLEGELFGRGAWNANMVREELDAPARTYLLDVLGEAEQAVVRGYAGFWYDGEDAELMTIGVGKAYQRQGIAAALLQVLVDEAKRQGASRMALYQRFGFERMGLRKRYYQPEGIDAYTMSLDLKPRVVGFAAPQTASADIEDITSKQTEKNGEAR